MEDEVKMEYVIIFDKASGVTLAKVPRNTNLYSLYDFEVGVYNGQNAPSNWKDFKIDIDEMIPMSTQDYLEISHYGKLLTNEERLLRKLKPTLEEVKKAENTIEILTLIQEVM